MASDGPLAVLRVPVTADDHAEGPPAAPVTLVEYGDYECPHCGHAYPIVKEVQKQLGTQLRFVFRNFPLRESHPHAQHAAEAAEAAADQGRFWEMHDLLFERQDALDDAHLAQYARALGLDEGRFVAALTGHEFAARVRRDFTGGVRSGVNGTPTFFINGVRYDDSWDLATLVSAVRAAIEAA
jgi:protein-disulfide isomerase